MVRKYTGFSGIILGGSAALLATQPAWAATAAITSIQLQPTEDGLSLLLETSTGQSPQVSTTGDAHQWVAEVVNAQLRLPHGESFYQQHPMPGISAVRVTALDANRVRVSVVGDPETSLGKMLQLQSSKGLLLSLSNPQPSLESAPVVAAATEQPDQTPTTTARSTVSPEIASNPESAPTSISVPTSPTLIAQTPAVLVPNPKVTVTGSGVNSVPTIAQPSNIVIPNPRITLDGTGSNSTSAPTPSAAPPTLPRAIAPPVGDIAISNIGGFTSVIDLGTSQRVPRLVLRDAPVREVLTLLARAAGLNVAFTTEAPTRLGQATLNQDSSSEGPRISLDIENESIQDVFNHVLRVSGLQANRVGRTIFVGVRLPVEARNVVVRSLRLNQVSVVDAANFLSAQGAETQQPITRVTIQQVGTGLNARDVEIREPAIIALAAREGTGTLLLTGLSIVADARTNTITLIGEPQKVEMASSLLTQLDARKRQVIVNVKIVDVNLLALNESSSSFSFGINDSFFVFDKGAAVLNFGPYNPPQRIISNHQSDQPDYRCEPLRVGNTIPRATVF
ncbi:type IV pilus secretin family protein [Neosynechococcus sphagnicola]|uniref:type IV pilus secretin family protein n=1 Tax=Neosynechococcus sphagnicola TaxID=1501145 RepID=UPI0019554059|nr:type IV pilus secretin family protein [Neosynechococcus sphagnicola]